MFWQMLETNVSIGIYCSFLLAILGQVSAELNNLQLIMYNLDLYYGCKLFQLNWDAHGKVSDSYAT